MKHSSSVGNLNTIDLTEPVTAVTGTTTAKGTVVDAVIKLYYSGPLVQVYKCILDGH